MATWTGDYELRKLQVRYSRSPTGMGSQDVAVTTHHFLNLTADEPDATWTTGDYTTVEGAWDTLWTSLKARQSPTTRLDQFRWYKDGPAFHPTPEDGNPADRVTERDVPGTLAAGDTILPPQVAISVTERTALRKRWGRFYLPAGGSAYCTANGDLGASAVDFIADAVEIFYNACRAADLIPVVFSPTTEAAFSVDQTQVDSLYDVIRSRRWSSPAVRDTRTLVAI